MATLVLTVIGTAIGGPIGGAIGAAIGQQVDRAVLAPGGRREGPRLKELDVQTSSYGSAIPAIFGAMRVAGTVIWASDLIERRSKSGGGKGRPKTVNYSYSVNMAVALSSRPVARVGRIWADGNLIRGSAGDFKVETAFRFYHGHSDQSLDPLMASAQGPAHCPAHRGLAYAMFEELQLADFGNRIPSMTFELFERDGAVLLVDIAAALSGGLISGSARESVDGFAAVGHDARDALSPLLAALPVMLRWGGDGLELTDWWQEAAAIAVEPLAKSGGQGLERPARQLAPTHAAAQSLAIRHYEPARDYQAGLQQSSRGGTARTAQQIDLPAALNASAALRLVDLQLAQTVRGRDSLSGYFVLDGQRITAGDWITGEDGEAWRVTEVEHQRNARKITAIRHIAADISTGATASAGQFLPGPDLAVGDARLMLVDVPAMGVTDPARPVVALFAAGTQAGWQRAALSLVQGDGLIELGGTAAPATMGVSLNALPAHTPSLVDEGNHVDVELLHDAMALPPGPGSPLAADAPLVLLGGEYIIYGHAEYLGAAKYRLSSLLRGCFGSEVVAHEDGADFLLFEAESAKLTDELPLPIGWNVTVGALGVGDAEPVAASLLVAGNAIKPRAPVHGVAAFSGDGSLAIHWVRRSRIDAGWQDGVDQPLGEESEQYRVEISSSGEVLASRTVAQSAVSLSAAEIAAWALAAGAPIDIAITQVGRFAASDPLTISVSNI